MSLDPIITVNITRGTSTPSEEGFGTPLIAAYFSGSIFPEYAREYTSLAGMATDGFTSADPAYKAASACFSQSPSPPIVKIGRRDNAPQQSIKITPKAPTLGMVYNLTVEGYDNGTFATRAATSDSLSYTAPSALTDAEDVCDAVVLGFVAASGDFSVAKTGTGASAYVTLTADNINENGNLFGITGDNFEFEDLTADPGLANDLNAIYAYDPDWYGLALDSNSAKEIVGAAGWVATNEKLLVCQTADEEVVSTTNSADDTSIAALLEDATRERTMLFFHRSNQEYVGAAMLGAALPSDPGSITWAYKQLTGITAQRLTATEQGRAESKNVNTVTTLAGVNVTRYGSTSSGEFTDVMRGADWLGSRIQTDVFAALIQNGKVPYTDAGLQMLRGVVLGRLQDGVARDFLAANPEPTVTVPRASEVLASLKASRTVDPITFQATLSGAVHKVAIDGRLNL